MRHASVLSAGVVAAALVVLGALMAQVQPAEAAGPSDRYVVVLKEGASDPGRAAEGMARRYGLGVGLVYGHALDGFSALIPEGRLGAVRADGRVERVEPDKTYHAATQTLPWGINKIDADASSTRAANGSGSVTNVNAYVIDSGIYRHADLAVVKNVNFTGDGKPTDCHGHGTHLAGTIAAKDNDAAVVGASPGAPLTGVKVLGCNGSGTLTSILKGVDWVTANAEKPAIANMSLSGPASQTLDEAIRGSAGSGILYSVAAGNDGARACNYSPARAGAGTNNGIVTTAATDKYDRELSWSNYGSCVDIWAPGVGILSTRKGGGTKSMGGTSQAAAHVGGGAALYLSSHAGAAPSNVESALEQAAKTAPNKSKSGSSIAREYVGGF
jgi:subtilisin family serine protease